MDFEAGEEFMVAATTTPHKHVDGNGLHGAPPVDFENERVYVQSCRGKRWTLGRGKGLGCSLNLVGHRGTCLQLNEKPIPRDPKTSPKSS